MVWAHHLDKEWIGLHTDKVLYVLEYGLHKAIVIGVVVELRASNLGHQLSGLGRVVCLKRSAQLYRI